jgi:3-oxoadipate enol-lactonase
MGDTTVGGVRIHYEEQGEGPDVLVIPGAGGDARAMGYLSATLAAHYHVVTIENRGAGRSDIPDGPYSTAQMAGDARALLERLDIQRAHVVGHSMGSCVAQELVLSHPANVGKLVLISPWIRLRDSSSEFNRFLEWALEQDPPVPSLWLVTFPWFAAPRFMAQEPLVQAAVSMLSHARSPEREKGRVNQLRAAREHDTTGRLGNVRASTLVLAGGDDIISPPAHTREVASSIPGAQIEIIDDAGHGIIYEFPDRVNEALLAFLHEPA